MTPTREDLKSLTDLKERFNDQCRAIYRADSQFETRNRNAHYDRWTLHKDTFSIVGHLGYESEYESYQYPIDWLFIDPAEIRATLKERDEAAAQAEAVEAERRAADNKAEQEKRDRQTYARLAKKYGKP